MTKLRDKRLFLLDMDGTIYIGDRLFDGVPEFLRHVRAMGGRYLFLTNNSSRGVEGYMEKLRRMGIETTRDDYLTSVDATVRYLRETLPEKTCYVFGTDSFLAQLDGAGIPVTRDREQAEVLLCGFDTELTFQKLEDACILLNRGVPFVATNPDWVCPTWYGSVPDCGSVCRMLTTATGREPTVIGKPRPQMALLAMERTGFSPEQTVLLGDRLYTDVACGVNAGIDTVFVLSGEGTMADIDTYQIHPTWVYPDTGGDCMKLNYKRTIFVGFAFFLICSFWQAYDNTIPLILTNKFGMSQAWSGVIMALDNVLALFMLPLFGAISDKHRGKRGRRTPFIVVGTLIAAVMLIALSFVDNAQLRHLSDVSAIDDPAALEQIYDRQANETLLTPSGDKFVLSQKFTQEEFIRIRSQVEQDGKTVTNPDYTNYVVPARQACAWDATAKSPATLVFFIVLLLIVLVSMAVFRSPAVALMPDVTLKPLRSKANAVINLMGSAGGILVLALGMVFATSAVRNSLMSYTGYFAVIAAIMLAALVIFMLTVREKEWAYEMQQQAVALGIEEETREQEESAGGRKLSVDEVKSLIFLLLSIVLWFFGYNAVTSKYSVYASNILHKDYNLTLIIAQAAAIVSYLPVGFIASKAGRKKTILAGVVMLTTAFTVAAFLNAESPTMLMNAMFALAGIAWATINVNSFPMVVEMCSGGDVGKYTGFYYTASMAAQVATPMLSGLLMDRFGMHVLFPYAAVFTTLAFVTMLFVRHGDSKPQAKIGLEALDEMED